jgi:hypothetical protein
LNQTTLEALANATLGRKAVVHGTRHSAGVASRQVSDWAHAFVMPTLSQAIIKLIVLYLFIVIIVMALTFVFKSDSPSATSTVAFWIMTLASVWLIFGH